MARISRRTLLQTASVKVRSSLGSLRDLLVDLLPDLRRRALDVHHGAPGHEDGRRLRAPRHLDPQRPVVLEEERSGDGLRLAADRLGWFVLIQVRTGHVGDEDPVPQPFLEYRLICSRITLWFHSSNLLKV